MEVLIVICGRKGSKGLPNKNVLPLNGKPLVAYTIETALGFINKNGGTIGVSSDDEDLLKIASDYSLDISYKRPIKTATDEVGKLDAIIDVKEYYEAKHNLRYDYVIDLDITSPLRTVNDLEEALEVLHLDNKALSITSVSEPKRNPYFNMVEFKKDSNYVKVVKEKQAFLSRQQSPEVYDLNASFYILKKQFFIEGYRTGITDFSLVYLMPHICFDIDCKEDFEYMEFVFEKGKANFIS